MGNGRLQSVLTDYPRLIDYWDYEKNIELDPSKITVGSSKKVWWKCELNHQWCTAPKKMKLGKGCPYCSNRKLLEGYNDLKTVHPELALEWDEEKNGELMPNMIITGSRKIIWWRCKNNHSWEAYVYSRVSGSGCPYCAGRYAIAGENDLLTLRPDIAKDWNYSKNETLNPSEWSVGSGKKIWWKCKNGHERYIEIYQRVSTNGCPECKKCEKLGSIIN